MTFNRVCERDLDLRCDEETVRLVEHPDRLFST